MTKIKETESDQLLSKAQILPLVLDKELQYAIASQRALKLLHMGIINQVQFSELNQLNRKTFQPQLDQCGPNNVDITGTQS